MFFGPVVVEKKSSSAGLGIGEARKEGRILSEQRRQWGGFGRHQSGFQAAKISVTKKRKMPEKGLTLLNEASVYVGALLLRRRRAHYAV